MVVSDMEIKNIFKNKMVKVLSLIFVLFLFTMISPIVNLYNNSNREIILDPLDVSTNKIPLVKGSHVSQTLHLQGKLKSLELYIFKPDSMVEDISFNITLKQDNEEFEEKVIISSSEFNTGYYNIDIGNIKIREGTVDIDIIGLSEISDENHVPALYASNQVGSGLPNMIYNENECTSPMSLKYVFFNTPTWSAYTLMLLCLLFIVICVTSYMLVFKIDIIRKYDYLLVIQVFLIIFLTVSARQPVASFLGEPKSEAAYDFWYSQVSNGALESLFRLEAGLYLSWLQRIVTFISVKLFSVKYVFVAMQVITVIIISFFCSLFCSKLTVGYLGEILTALVAIFLGCSEIFANAYMFHALGYWGLLFILWLVICDINKIRKITYIMSILLTVVLCFSKLFIVAWVPVALFYLIFRWRKLSNRLRIFYCLLTTLPTVHLAYIFIRTSDTISQRQGVGSFTIPALNTLLENLIYYETQAIEAIFIHTSNPNPLISNIVILIICIFMICSSVYLSISKETFSHKIGIFMIGCWILSFSSVGICILGGLGNIDMSSKVDWTINNWSANFHWIYIYIPIFFILLTYIYLIKNRIEKIDEKDLKNKAYVLLLFLILPTALYYSEPIKSYIEPSEYQVEWSKIYKVTENESYYVPVNVELPGAQLISLQHNSAGKMFGFNLGNNWCELTDGINVNFEIPYESASVASIENESIISITVRCANTNFDCNYSVLLLDKDGNIIKKVQQSTSDDREWMTFMMDEPYTGINQLKFVYSETDTPAYVKGIICVGFVAMGVHS